MTEEEIKDLASECEKQGIKLLAVFQTEPEQIVLEVQSMKESK